MSESPDWLQHGYPYTPYGGLPPTPAELFQRWNLDPLLVCALILVLVVYAVGAEPRGPGALPRWRKLCFYAAWGLGTLALISPLCALSVSLFSARIGQQMLLVTVVAPLAALGRPGAALARGHHRRLGRLRARVRPGVRQPILASIAFAAAFWVWRAPVAYAATFESSAAYWTMQLTMFSAALWLCTALLGKGHERPGGFVLASLMTAIQMNALAAFITVSSQLIYLPHVVTTAAWGLTPLEDQRLGGVLMWAPAAVIFIVAVIAAFSGAGRRQRAGGAAPDRATHPA